MFPVLFDVAALTRSLAHSLTRGFATDVCTVRLRDAFEDPFLRVMWAGGGADIKPWLLAARASFQQGKRLRVAHHSTSHLPAADAIVTLNWQPDAERCFAAFPLRRCLFWCSAQNQPP